MPMQIRTDENRKEIKTHGTWAFPVLVSHEYLSSYERMMFMWHWHTELEWTYVLEGRILYQVNDQIFEIVKGQGILCNSNMLHTGQAIEKEDCHYVSITFHPRLLEGYENSFLQKKYVSPMVENSSFPCIFLGEEPWQKRILVNLKNIEQLYQTDAEYGDFRIYLLLMECWMEICSNVPAAVEDAGAARDMERLKKILSFIHSHYHEKLTLEQISAEVNICSSECCRFFKKYMKQTIFDYLLDYRISRSMEFLANETVTEAGEHTGFASPAYFTKIFRQKTGYTPREYQKNVREAARKV